jgi:hypothetical protein
MGTRQDGKKLLIGTFFCFLVPGLLILLFLANATYSHSERQVCFCNLLDKPAQWENSSPLSKRSEVSDFLSPGLHKALLHKLAASHWWQTNLPDPPPSVSLFIVQTNLYKFLDKWPTPGLTISPDMPPNGELTDEDLL